MDEKTPKKSTRTRRPNVERREESMTLILDHAEAEFAANGYNGTTLARVAAVAGIDAALMRYYFGDKEQLFAAVFRRRGPAVNEARFKAFADYEAEFGDAGTLEGVIEAFVRPAFEAAQLSQGHRNYAAIVAYVNSSRGAQYALMSEVFDDISKALVHHMRRVMPEAPPEAIYWVIIS
nr:TetR/AcrR family transcriptional regulator [Novosphingobium sp. 9]